MSPVLPRKEKRNNKEKRRLRHKSKKAKSKSMTEKPGKRDSQQVWKRGETKKQGKKGLQ